MEALNPYLSMRAHLIHILVHSSNQEGQEEF